MARPSKGDRAAHMVKTHPAVIQRLVEKTSKACSSSVSQYVADVLALYVGLPEHVRELGRTPIVVTRKVDALRGDTYGRIMIRLHREVSERLASQTSGHVTAYIAGVLAAHVGLPDIRTTDRIGEALPLAM